MGVVACAIGAVVVSAAGLLHEPAEVEMAWEGSQIGIVDSLETQEADVSVMSPEDAARYAAGDALFKGNCAQCHAVNDVVVGPALTGISKRRPEKWIVQWVKNSSKVIASGDEYGLKLYEQYGKQQMPSFQLSEQEIKDILVYIETREGDGMVAAGAVAYD